MMIGATMSRMIADACRAGDLRQDLLAAPQAAT